MTIAFRVKVTGAKDVRDLLARMNPAQNRRITSAALLIGGQAVKTEAAQRQLIVGRRTAAPDRTRVTVRSSRLQKSIRVNRAGMPKHVDIGSDVAYARQHETGGVVSIPAHNRKHPRSGRVHRVRAHTARYPQRSYLTPALEEVAPKMPRVFLKSWVNEMQKRGKP